MFLIVKDPGQGISKHAKCFLRRHRVWLGLPWPSSDPIGTAKSFWGDSTNYGFRCGFRKQRPAACELPNRIIRIGRGSLEQTCQVQDLSRASLKKQAFRIESLRFVWSRNSRISLASACLPFFAYRSFSVPNQTKLTQFLLRVMLLRIRRRACSVVPLFKMLRVSNRNDLENQK